MTCWRRLRDWHEAGVWQRLHESLLAGLHESLLAGLHAAGELDWSKAVTGGSYIRAMKGGPKPARARLTVPGRARGTT